MGQGRSFLHGGWVRLVSEFLRSFAFSFALLLFLVFVPANGMISAESGAYVIVMSTQSVANLVGIIVLVLMEARAVGKFLTWISLLPLQVIGVLTYRVYRQGEAMGILSYVHEADLNTQFKLLDIYFHQKASSFAFWTLL